MGLRNFLIVALMLCLHCSCSSESNRMDVVQIPDRKIPSIAKGEKIAMEKCTSCHALKNKDCSQFGMLVSAMGDDYFGQYVTNQKWLIEREDGFALEIKQKWGNDTFLHHFHLSEEEIQSLILYLK